VIGDWLASRAFDLLMLGMCLLLLALILNMMLGCDDTRVVEFQGASVNVERSDEGIEMAARIDTLLVESLEAQLAIDALVLEDDTVCLHVAIGTETWVPPIESASDARCARWLAGESIEPRKPLSGSLGIDWDDVVGVGKALLSAIPLLL
jgi:hypothetical protein